MQQIEQSKKNAYQFFSRNNNNATYSLQTSEGSQEVSATNCSCSFFNSMKLPCRHILQLRHKQGISLFDPNLCSKRWTNEYFRLNHKFLSTNLENQNCDNVTSIEVSSFNRKTKLNSQQKYVTALNLCKKICNTLSQNSHENFSRHLEQLKSLQEHWSQGHEVGIQLFSDISNQLDEVSHPSSSSTLLKNDEILNDTDNDVPCHFDIITHDECNVKNDVEATLTTLINNVVCNVDTMRKSECVSMSKLKAIKVQPPLKGKGRPKGSKETNVIGLKKSSSKNSCLRFCNLRYNEKLRKTLSICIGEKLAEKVLSSGSRVQLEHVFPTEIDPAAFNPILSIESIKYLFEPDAWDRFYSYYVEKEQYMKDRCFACSKTSDENVSCEKCLRLFDLTCAKLKQSKRKRPSWFCQTCKAENMGTDNSVKENEEPAATKVFLDL